MNSNLSNLLNFLLLALALILLPFSASQAKSFDDGEVMHVDYPGWFNKNPFFDLAEDLDNAKSEDKKGLMVLFTTEGCSYCNIFIKKSLGDSELASIVQQNFVSVGMDIFDDAEMTDPRGVAMRVKHFAKKQGAALSPTLLFFSHDGQRILRAVGYQSPQRFKIILNYLTGDHYRSESLRDYISRHPEKPSRAHSYIALKEDPLFSKPPYALDRSRFPARQPLLVIFEKTGCEECEDFHTDVLALNEVRNTLKQFEVVRLDANDEKTPVLSPDGNRVTPASWFKQSTFSRLPALLFFDEKGNEVLKTDALVLRSRMMNSLNYVIERAYEKGWIYQRFARSKGIERQLKKQNKNK